MPSSTTATAAGQARNEDVEEGNDGTDNALEDGSNTVHNGHKASADGVEEALDA